LNENVAYRQVLNYTRLMEILKNTYKKSGANGSTKSGRHCPYYRRDRE
jgi:hypothetical protein